MIRHIYLFKESGIAATYGVGTYINSLLSCLNHVQHKITVVELLSNVKVLSVDFDSEIRTIKIPKTENNSRQLYYRNAFYLLRSFVDDRESVVFHLNFMSCEPLAEIIKRYFPLSRIVLTIHYSTCGIYGVDDKKIIESEKALINEYCDKVIAISEHRRRSLIERYHTDPAKIVVIPNGISDEYLAEGVRMDKLNSCREWFRLSDEKLILFVGRLDQNKGVDLLLDAYLSLCEDVENVHLIVAGNGEIESSLKTLKHNWGKVSFTGFLDKSDLLALYSVADIGVIPSRYEEFGYVAIEMLMHGLPIIANKTSGLADIFVDGETGMLIDLDDSDYDKSVALLAKTMKMLLRDKELKTKLSDGGRACFLKQYDIVHFERSMNLFYTD